MGGSNKSSLSQSRVSSPAGVRPPSITAAMEASVANPRELSNAELITAVMPLSWAARAKRSARSNPSSVGFITMAFKAGSSGNSAGDISSKDSSRATGRGAEESLSSIFN